MLTSKLYFNDNKIKFHDHVAKVVSKAGTRGDVDTVVIKDH